MILLIDNYDSFVHNLARYFNRLGQNTIVARNDATDVSTVRALKPDAIVLSPGPCTPTEAGCSLDVVRHLWREIPILGVCLGHQTIAAALGGQVVRAPVAMHGRTSVITHDGLGVFQNIPNPTTVCRYHSLIVEETSLPKELEVTARTVDGVVMAIQHRDVPVAGVQFHPEAILTDFGYPMLANFLTLAGISVENTRVSRSDELIEVDPATSPLPSTPVTF